MFFISRKKLQEWARRIDQKAFDRGYEVAWQMRSNKGCILAGSKLDREIDEILGGKR